MAIVRVGYPEAQVSKDDFTNIQQAIGRLVDSSLKGVHPQARQYVLD